MPSWSDVLEEMHAVQPHPTDTVRRKYLANLHRHTKRNVIAYYSGWLSSKPNQALIVNDEDKNAFMAAIHKLDRSKGLDLLLHTPGGDLAAAESLVDYLRRMFGTDIRAIVPQLAMSAGTMIACSCKEIVMGKQSNLGPIDPQFNGLPANGVIAEFKQAIDEVKKDPSKAIIWQAIIGKYHPTFLGTCQKAIEWAQTIVNTWLTTGMLNGVHNSSEIAKNIVEGLSSHDATYNHARHIHIEELEGLGLKITRLEDDPKLQDLVLTVHHAFMHTFSMTRAIKIVENHMGVGVVRFVSPNS